MTTYIYDGSFEGVLTCIFEVYRSKIFPSSIISEFNSQPGLLDDVKYIATNEDFSARVLAGVDARSNAKASVLLYRLFLSELPDIETVIYQLVKIIIDHNDATVLENYANEYVLKASQVSKMIGREVHRMHAFVRFQKTQQGIFYAAIEPDFNVLPLIGEHFERRYADQSWVIFDTKRHYGLHYDLNVMFFIAADHPVLNFHKGLLPAAFVDEKEIIYQALWEKYFHSVNIKERKNLKLHLRHMPKRYWKYLIEKRRA